MNENLVRAKVTRSAGRRNQGPSFRGQDMGDSAVTQVSSLLSDTRRSKEKHKEATISQTLLAREAFVVDYCENDAP